MLINSNGTFLTTRKFDFYSVEGYECLQDIYATEGITLLDGEMVKHIPTGHPMFLIFDILALNGNDVGSEPLHERLRYVRNAVDLYRTGITERKIPEHHPFPIIGKPFYPKRFEAYSY
jgi:hypothetical protein